MARKKNYEINEARSEKIVAASAPATRPTPSVQDAYIDMEALLGPDARFPGTQRVLDLQAWLGFGFDAFVCTAGYCLKTLALSGSRSTSSIGNYYGNLAYFFDYLKSSDQSRSMSRPQFPSDLSPLHLQHFVGWLKKQAQSKGWESTSLRSAYKGVKAVLVEMFSQGFIDGNLSLFFPRGAVSWRSGEGRQTSLSEAEQSRLAKAIKSDFSDVHHGRLTLSKGAMQGIRLLLVAHRQGLNPTPLLEMRRDALIPGFLPGTVRVRTSKHRSKKVRTSVARAARGEQESTTSSEAEDEQDLVFDLSEGAVLQQAIDVTRELVAEAPPKFKQRIWLYRVHSGKQRGTVTALSLVSLSRAIDAVIKRRGLTGDDGQPLRLNLSRLRKSSFDRALRAADGDMAVTANLMGNTPRVAARHYPSMNEARKAEAAGFMNDDYLAMMRVESPTEQRPDLKPVRVHPIKITRAGASVKLPTQTPVSACKDSMHGEYAPNDGRSHCDRFVMCLFCSSFAVVGSVDELWRLFSFQAFARAELEYLNERLGPERTQDQEIEELRDRYRIAIPYIDDFTGRQFAPSRVAKARAKTKAGLHPYWQHHMAMSLRARKR